MLLRPFSYDNVASGNGEDGNKQEKWPQPKWQGSVKSNHWQESSKPLQAKPGQAKVSNSNSGGGNKLAVLKDVQEEHRNVRLIEITKEHAQYDGVLRLVNRFLNPSHKIFSGTAQSICEVESIHQVVCPEAKKEFDHVVRGGGSGGATAASATVVSKFLSLFDKEHILRRGSLGQHDMICGPIGDAVHFGNVFDEGLNSSQSPSLSPERRQHHGGGGGNASEEILLCEVAAGRICMNPSKSFVEQLSEESGSTSSANAAVQECLNQKGFDTITTNMIGAPHLTVVDLRRILPSHIVKYKRSSLTSNLRTGSNSSDASRVGHGNQNSTGASAGNSSSSSSSSSSNGPRKAIETKLQQVGNQRSQTLEGSKRAATLIRQQFRDLEESLRQRRDFLLSQVRQEEEKALSAIASREVALETQLKAVSSRGGGDSDGQVLEDSVHEALFHDENYQLQVPFSHVSLDTSRLMGMIDHLRVEGLTSAENGSQSSGGSIPRARSANTVLSRSQQQSASGSLRNSSTASSLRPIEAFSPLKGNNGSRDGGGGSGGGGGGGGGEAPPPMTFVTSEDLQKNQTTPPRPQTSPMPPGARGTRPALGQTSASGKAGGGGGTGQQISRSTFMQSNKSASSSSRLNAPTSSQHSGKPPTGGSSGANTKPVKMPPDLRTQKLSGLPRSGGTSFR